MVIQNMFVEDINRKINGVVKVDEDENKVLEQELNEYVITRELKRHFADFFNTYAEAFDEPTADTGVWISGFFGSGKSHFLKMLSYLLENKEVNGIRTWSASARNLRMTLVPLCRWIVQPKVKPRRFCLISIMKALSIRTKQPFYVFLLRCSIIIWDSLAAISKLLCWSSTLRSRAKWMNFAV